MSERTTHKDAQRAFGRLIEAIGGRVAKSYNDVGAYVLDYNPIYGGCIVERVNNERGGVSQPFGTGRQAPAQFVRSVRFAVDAIRVKEGA